MKCPFCNTQGLIVFTISEPYCPEGSSLDLANIPIELKFFCNKCKKNCDISDILLKSLYGLKGKIHKAFNSECVDGITILHDTGLPMSEIKKGLSILNKKKQMDVVHGNLESDVGDIYVKITDLGKEIVEQNKIL